MADFVIFVDSGCDLPADFRAEHEVHQLDLKFHFIGEDKEYGNSDMDIVTFYNRMRAGEVAKTSAVNTAEFLAAFEPELQAGNNVLYIAMSAGISSTSESGALAVEQLQAKYPERRIVHLDPLCASLGVGMVVYRAIECRDEGKTIDDTVAVLKEMAPHVVHWFTVADLVYLQRGGRVSKVSATAANIMNIKPVMHVADDGKLYNVFKAHGRARAIAAIAKKYTETCFDPKGGRYMISHGDCLEDAKQVERLIVQAGGPEATMIAQVGPVIGAHSGPGTIALFFVGEPR